MKAIFLYNHNDYKVLRKLKYINKEFSSYFELYKNMCINSLEELDKVIKEEVKEYDLLIFSGGDGTFNNVINNVIKYNIDIKIGYLPTGTANDIAHNLKISRHIKQAIKIIKNNHIVNQKVFLFNKRYFVYVNGIGKFTSVSYKSKIAQKRIFGTFAYVFKGMKELFKRVRIKGSIKIDEKEIEVNSPLILVLNSKYIGGKKVNKYGFRNDTTLDLIVVKKGMWPLMNIVFMVIFGKGKKENKFYFNSYQGKKFEFNLNDNRWCIDGESEMSDKVEIISSDKYINIYTSGE